MRKTCANPTRLVHRIQHCASDLNSQLATYARVLETLEASIDQGDVTDPGEIADQLRWAADQLNQLPPRLDRVRAQTLATLQRLDARHGLMILKPPEQPQTDQFASVEPSK